MKTTLKFLAVLFITVSFTSCGGAKDGEAWAKEVCDCFESADDLFDYADCAETADDARKELKGNDEELKKFGVKTADCILGSD